MKRFENILVGVDLSSNDRLVAHELAPPTEAAVERAIWLASHSGARVTFQYALDVSHATERLIEENPDRSESVFDIANRPLARLVERARRRGVDACSRLSFGRSWYELIAAVVRDGYDLVVVGTRDVGPVQRTLFGSTAIKLLRKCPCPVWVTKPGGAEVASVLVAHDLTPVGTLALELGASMAQLNDAQLTVLHAVEHSEIDEFFSGNITVDESAARRERARELLEAEFANVGGNPSAIELGDERPDRVILDWVATHAVDLLVMGTVARTGIRGFFTGNTAERLLPMLTCSVLAVKPAEFVCPVTVDGSHDHQVLDS